MSKKGKMMKGSILTSLTDAVEICPTTSIEVLEATREAADSYDEYGFGLVVLGDEHIEALRDGKMLAWFDGEYSTLIVLRRDGEEA